ncbi:DNA polymerase III subunit alpha [Clostridium botulinum C]|nr:PHP domain-containing protein [Clostridium botulinum]MCD3200171.1 DNA polymerase III subunit alpha [Clostridium botulinum C]MCD3378252.1 DNA polymerase III subunit alpha [Clostridium botulinum C]
MNKLKSVFVHLHVHSEYSNLRLKDATNKIEGMVRYVSLLGQHSLALTDHESLSGHIKFLKVVKELKEKGEIHQDFKPILGNEIYLTDESTMRYEMEHNGGTTFYHFILLAKDKEGHKQLRQLSTRAWERMFSYKGMERVPTFYSDFEDVIGDDKGHLIGSTACLGGYIAQNILKILNTQDEDEILNYKYKIHDFITWCIDMFGKDNFYIELQPSRMVEQIEYNKMAMHIAKTYGLKYIITTDAHYLRKEDREIHKAFLTSDEDGNSNREVDDFYSSTHFFNVDMLFEYMGDYLSNDEIIEAIKNTNDISNSIQEYDLFHKQIIPKVPLPNEDTWFHSNELYKIGEEYKHIKYMIHSKEKYDRYLIGLCFKGIEKKIKKENLQESLERLDVECSEIIGISKAKEEPMSSYFVTMQKNIDIIWDDAESLVMPSRGSAGGFLVDYLIGITQVNPLTQGITMPHWRFISAERPDYPDIDIDFSSYKRDAVFNCLLDYYKSIGGDLVRVCTFGTETAKSAIQTACRGVHINNDIGLYLSSLIPVERGKVWTLSECYYGDESKGKRSITEFKNAIDEHSGKNLLQVALGIEGLINKRSSHPCGVLPVNGDFTEHNAKMRSPSGELISQWELHDSEECGGLKYDFLNTKTCAMIQKTLEMLINHEKIEWQGSLRKTYDKYLHPDVIDTQSPEMWQKLNDGELISAFQFDSLAGEQALKAIKPMNLLEASAGNTLMRLMVEDGQERPLEMYVRYKQDINEWYKDMRAFGLNDNEMKLLEKHLSHDYGVCATQESMMMLSMDQNIAGFDVVESNILRKSVAKKKSQLLQESKNKLYEKGLKRGTSETLLDYVWDKQIAMQKGYSFSILHTIGYTYILIQQLNLIHYYPPIYWNTAVLLVESGAIEQVTENEEIDRKEKITNYGTVAKAIGNMQDKGVHIALPNINIANVGFEPNEANNEIVFGLKGIMKINNDTAKTIMENRPFTSVQDFYKRMVLQKKKVTSSTGKIQNKSLVSDSQLITLIKAGAFDKIENKPRETILLDYLKLTNPPKKIDARATNTILEMGIIPTELKEEIRFFKFREYVKTLKSKKDEKLKSVKWYCLNGATEDLTEYTEQFFNDNFISEIEEDKDYYYDDNGSIWVALGTTRKGSFESVYKQKINGLTKWLSSDECINTYNKYLFEQTKEKNMSGTISTWEMESMNFYYHEHELANVNKEKYSIVNYNNLPEEPMVTGFTKYKNMQYPKFQLSRIVGTVLDRNKNKHVVSLLTPDGVVNIKFYSGQFAFYDRSISEVNEEDGKKTVLEDGWFKRGTLLLVTGFRRGDQFKPKRYKNSIYPHTLQKILEIKENGDLVLQSERVNIDSK